MDIICDCETKMDQVNCLTTIFADDEHPHGGRIDEFVCKNCGNAVLANMSYYVAKEEKHEVRQVRQELEEA